MIHYDLESKDKVLTKNEKKIHFSFMSLLIALFLGKMLYDYESGKLSEFLFIIFWGPLLIVHEPGHGIAA